MNNLGNLGAKPFFTGNESFYRDKEDGTTETYIYSVSFLFIILYFCLMVVKLNDELPKYMVWSLIQIPLLIGLFKLAVMLIADVSNPKRRIFRKGVIFIIFETLINWLMISMFIVLLHIKLDDDYLQTIIWVGIFSPLYIANGFLFLVIVFLAPGLLDQRKKLYRLFFLICMYWLGTLVFIILLPNILDEVITFMTVEALFNIFWLMYFLHIASIIWSFKEN